MSTNKINDTFARFTKHAAERFHRGTAEVKLVVSLYEGDEVAHRSTTYLVPPEDSTSDLTFDESAIEDMERLMALE